MSYSAQHLTEAIEIVRLINPSTIESMADLLANVKKEGGRIFFLGVGGSAGNCSHAVNDFRKIVGIELTYEDYNYIVATLKMNEGFDYSTKKPSDELKRPIAAVYSFDVDEHRTESVRRTYRHKMLSYDIDLLIPTAELLQGDGNFDYYEGREVDIDYYDGDTNSVEFDKDSIVKIE